MAKKQEKAEAAPVAEAKPAKVKKAKAVAEAEPVPETKPVVAAAVAPKPKKIKNAGRFAPKNKSRLPRKLKKARAKAAAKAALTPTL
jgi:hypothetical protein